MQSEGQTPFAQASARFKAYIQSIPPQTLGLLGTCVSLAVLDLLTLDLVSQGLTLERTANLGNEQSSHLVTIAILMVLSPFSPIHGLFAVLLSVYFGKDTLADYENSVRNQPRIVLDLALRQFLINAVTLLCDKIWFLTFPVAWTRMAISGGFGGLFPIICFLEAEAVSTSSSSSSETTAANSLSQTEIPLLPFTVTRRAKPWLLAFLYSILGGGDIDLFVAVMLGFSASLLRNAFRKISLLIPSQSSRVVDGANTEEGSALLGARARVGVAPQSSSSTATETTSSQPVKQSDAERRALMLAAAERRMQAESYQQSNNATSQQGGGGGV